MRFITELELSHPYTKTGEAIRKSEKNHELGANIDESFGWKEKTSAASTMHSLEIEAFPMSQWIEFKQKLFSKFIDDDYEGAELALELIKNLESFGK